MWALKGAKPNEQIKQKFYSSTDEVLQAARDLDANGWNAFFAMGTFFEAGSRAANNMQWMKSFFLDLDCGPNKEFPSQEVAIEAYACSARTTIYLLPHLLTLDVVCTSTGYCPNLCAEQTGGLSLND